jgi:hypothetical protein
MKPLRIPFNGGPSRINPKDLAVGLDVQLNILDNYDHVGPLTTGGGIGLLFIIQQIFKNQMAAR